MRLVALAAAILLAFMFASYAVYDARANAREQRRVFCQEIEALKAGNRERAWETFNRLDQNLRLLKLKKTKRIVRVAKANRDAELARWPARPC